MGPEAGGRTAHYRFLVVAGESYKKYFAFIARDLKGHAAGYGIDAEFTVDFTRHLPAALSKVISSPYDLYFIDGSLDNEVRAGNMLSDEIKEFHEGSIIIGMSHMGSFLKHEHHAYDITVDAAELAEELPKILETYGFFAADSQEAPRSGRLRKIV
jgi:hypothetical protein